MLTRYPHLQPVEDARLKSNYAMGKEVYEQQLDNQLDHLANCKHRMLHRLTPEQQKQLAALVFELSIHFEEHRRYAAELARLQKWIKSSRRLEHEVVQARRIISASIQRVRKLASDLNDPVGSDILAAAGGMRARVPLQELESWVNALVGNDYFRLFARDAATLAMVQLYWLFRHGFGFDAGRSELQVALMRNCLWTDFVKPVLYVFRNLGDQSTGCDAVRKAVQRFCVSQRTTP